MSPSPPPQSPTRPPTPITILTGFLGSGKTTLLLSLLPQLPPTYTLALLKNELGSLALDSQLASAASVSGVRELLNGCICCNLVGSLEDALAELRDGKVAVPESKGGGGNAVTATASGDEASEKIPGKRPDRIVIETSGAAFPATLVLELNRLIRASVDASPTQTPAYTLDGVISVIDVENWGGYPDTGVSAKMQAKFTDLVVLNKWEEAGEGRREWVRDRIGDLDGGDGSGGAVVWTRRGRVDVGVVLGIDGALVRGRKGVLQGLENERGHEHGHGHGTDSEGVNNGGNNGSDGTHSDVEVLSVILLPPSRPPTATDADTEATRSSQRHSLNLPKLDTLLTTAPKDEVYRIKAILHLASGSLPMSSDGFQAPPATLDSAGKSTWGAATNKYILNWAFGRWTWTPLPADATASSQTRQGEEAVCRMTIVTARYESTKWKRRIESERLISLHGADDDVANRGGRLSIEKVG